MSALYDDCLRITIAKYNDYTKRHDIVYTFKTVCIYISERPLRTHVCNCRFRGYWRRVVCLTDTEARGVCLCKPGSSYIYPQRTVNSGVALLDRTIMLNYCLQLQYRICQAGNRVNVKSVKYLSDLLP